MTLTARLASFFRARPGVWTDGRELATIAGAYAWRSRVSDLRRGPFTMTIQNRMRRYTRADGSTFIVSEYRLVEVEEMKETAARRGGVDALPPLL